jgi:hypothetical protein
MARIKGNMVLRLAVRRRLIGIIAEHQNISIGLDREYCMFILVCEYMNIRGNGKESGWPYICGTYTFIERTISLTILPLIHVK